MLEPDRLPLSISLYIPLSLSLSLSIYMYIYISLSLSLSPSPSLPPPSLSISLSLLLFSPLSSQSGEVLLRDASSECINAEELGQVKGGFAPLNTLAWFPDGRGFVTGGEDWRMRCRKDSRAAPLDHPGSEKPDLASKSSAKPLGFCVKVLQQAEPSCRTQSFRRILEGRGEPGPVVHKIVI